MAPQSFQLVMRSGPNPGKTFALSKSEITIGRDIGNDVVINDAEISRRHARLFAQGSSFVLEDLGSTNGTFVEGQRLMGPHMLRPGELILLGENVTLVYEPLQQDPDATVAAVYNVPKMPPSQRPEPPREPYPGPERPPAGPPPSRPPEPPGFEEEPLRWPGPTRDYPDEAPQRPYVEEPRPPVYPEERPQRPYPEQAPRYPEAAPQRAYPEQAPHYPEDAPRRQPAYPEQPPRQAPPRTYSGQVPPGPVEAYDVADDEDVVPGRRFNPAWAAGGCGMVAILLCLVAVGFLFWVDSGGTERWCEFLGFLFPSCP